MGLGNQYINLIDVNNQGKTPGFLLHIPKRNDSRIPNNRVESQSTSSLI